MLVCVHLLSMNKAGSFFCLLNCFAVLPWGQAIAGDINIQPCRFNGGKWIQVKTVKEGGRFTLNWADGPRMTYTLERSGSNTLHALDSLGGQWDLKSTSANGGLSLYNPSNGNRIVCAQAHGTAAICTITEHGIGPIQLGMTLLEARRAFPGATFSRGEDGDGVALIVVSVQKSVVMTLFAGEQDKNSPINWSKKIVFIRTSSPSCSTGLDVRPGSLVAEAEKRYGKVVKIVKTEIESREFAEFKNHPKGLIFQLDYSGVFREGQHETVSYRPERATSLTGGAWRAPFSALAL
jgi:hypothetical protein